MTVTNVTTPDSSFTPDDLPVNEDQIDVANVSESKSYDPMLNPELDELRAMIADRGVKGESRIREAANKKSFPLALQFEQVNQKDAFTLTLGELAASKAHEKGQQFVNPEDVRRVLYGTAGIALSLIHI